jgi:hypothetical protein
MAEAAIPNRDTFLMRVASDFRSMRQKLARVAKKAGSQVVRATKWLGTNAATQWVWNRTAAAARKVWAWSTPARVFTTRYVIDPMLVGAGAFLMFLAGSKILTALFAIGGLVAVIMFLNWLRKGWKSRTPVVEVVEEKVTTLETAMDQRRIAEENASRAAAEAAEARTTETAAAVEAQQVTEEVAEVVAQTVAPIVNGGYQVRLPDGDLNPNETLTQRFNFLDGLIKAEQAKVEPDPEYLCELQARRNLVHVRAGKSTTLKKDTATTAQIHREFSEYLEAQWMHEHPGGRLDRERSGVYRDALHRGAQAEDKRLKHIRELKALAEAQKGSGDKAA